MATISFQELLQQRFSRRELLSAGVALTPLAAAPGLLAATGNVVDRRALGFKPIAGSNADEIGLPPGYTHDVIARWGDSLFDAIADLDTAKLAAGCLSE